MHTVEVQEWLEVPPWERNEKVEQYKSGAWRLSVYFLFWFSIFIFWKIISILKFLRFRKHLSKRKYSKVLLLFHFFRKVYTLICCCCFQFWVCFLWKWKQKTLKTSIKERPINQNLKSFELKCGVKFIYMLLTVHWYKSPDISPSIAQHIHIHTCFVP